MNLSSLRARDCRHSRFDGQAGTLHRERVCVSTSAAAEQGRYRSSSSRPRPLSRDVEPQDEEFTRHDRRPPSTTSDPRTQRDDSSTSQRRPLYRRDEAAGYATGVSPRGDDADGSRRGPSAGRGDDRRPASAFSSRSTGTRGDSRGSGNSSTTSYGRSSDAFPGGDRDVATDERASDVASPLPSTASDEAGVDGGAGGGTGFRAGRTAARVKAVDATGIPVVRKRDEVAGGGRGGRDSEADGSAGFFSERTFKSVGASVEIATALSNLGITRPSHVQAQGYQAFLGSKGPVVLADQAGSGKTLAYLLPLIQQLRQQEAAAGGTRLAAPNKPRAIVLAPTVELVQQVYRVAKALSASGVPFRSIIMTGGQASDAERNRSWRTQKEALAGGVDLLVATPGRLLEHLNQGHVELGACNAIVLDEVDILLGNNAAFLEQVQPLQDAAPDGMRFVLVTATLPKHVFTSLQLAFPGIATAFGPGLHCTSKGLTEELVDCSGGDDVSLESGTLRKLDALRVALRKHRGRRVIVFCNKLEACRTVENYLRRQDRQEADFRVFAFHEAVAEDRRLACLNAFLTPDTASSSGSSSSSLGSSSGSGSAGRPSSEPALVLVCTDRTSRGIDSIYCDHVVLFDFPRDPSEYVRRVGRTARGAGGKGVVTALVLGRQVALAQDVMQRNERGVPVHRLPSS